MAESRTTLKTYFQTGDVPTEEQFETLIDSLQHVDDQIRTLVVTGNTTFQVPIGKTLLWLGIHCTGSQTLKLSQVGAGQDDLLYEQAVVNGQEISLNLSIWARASAKTIYVTGTALTLYISEINSAPTVV
jgi:hypothetical protein